MKKTVTINVHGSMFHIDEDATLCCKSIYIHLKTFLMLTIVLTK
jgi:hypothetical protein